ncbi:carotenoid oxygenase family protein [Streptomyces sp. NPDC048251]|uniref:carotenoid oxygenase family protein n=1 Tax=Streptomyces sp. NPDC048251 TaxID=3154501 RepID=UPI003420A108
MPETVASSRSSAQTHGDRSLGFTTMKEEVRVDSVDVEGTLPDWLSGRLIRLTPALLDYETATSTKEMGHWFDGLAMLNCFTIGPGKVGYASRFLESEAYASVRDKKESRYDVTFGTDPCRILGRRMMSVFDDKGGTDNTNINVTKVGERYMALTENRAPMEFDPETLQTYGPIHFDSDVPGQFGPLGHPHGDESGAMIGFFTQVGRKSSYRVHIWEPGTNSRREIARIPFKGAPRYMHSFAMTEKYIVLTAQPLHMRLARIMRTGKIMDGLDWDPQGRTEFLVVDRRNGRLVGRYESEPFFFFHHANAYDDGHDIVIDVVAMNDAASVWSLETAKLRDPDHKPRFYGELRRYRVSMTTGKVTVETLSDAHLEFPQINYGKVNGRPYQYVYGTAYRTPDSAWFDELVKIDVTTGSSVRWSEDGCFPGEPVFVRQPGEDGEDTGVVLSVVLDTKAGKSFLLALDANGFKELARAHAPHHIGFNFHGNFFRD